MSRQIIQNKVNTKVNIIIHKSGDKIMQNTLLIALVFLLMITVASVGGIPEPDMVFYGTVEIGGVPVTALDNHAIIARISGTSRTVGFYNMGDNLNADNNYVLKVRLEDLADGSSQNDNCALVGQDIDIYIRQPNNEELFADTASITGQGVVQELDLESDGEIYYGSDLDHNGITNLQDFALFAMEWGEVDCNETNNNCNNANLDRSNGVDVNDLLIFAQNWLD